MGELVEDLPKWFLQVNEHRIADYQLSALSRHFETAHVIFGHGFSDGKRPRNWIPDVDGIKVIPHVFPNWNTCENAGTAAFALEAISPDDDVLLICGDVIFSDSQIEEVVAEFLMDCEPSGLSAVTAFEGIQNEMTAVQWDERGRITDYGAIRGHQEAGIFVLNHQHIAQAKSIWENNKTSWFPIVFPRADSKVIKMTRRNHFEVNTPEDLRMVEEAIQTENWISLGLD